MENRPSIFISYTRRDDSGVAAAKLLEGHLRAAGFDEVWRDASRLTAGDVWAAAIEREIERCDVLLAVISPAYRDSEICRAEHILALRLKRRVIPLLTDANAPVPLHLVPRQFLDLSRADFFPELVRALLSSGPCDQDAELQPQFKKRRSNITGMRRPERFVARAVELDALKRLVLSEESSPSTSIVGVRGQGGIGKTVLAAELARDDAAAAAFPDGIIWLPIGREPRNLASLLAEAARILDSGSGDFSSEIAAYNTFREFVRGKAALIILDDVWDAGDVRPFLPLDDIEAPRFRVLCTTRKRSVTFGLRASEFPLDVLAPELARKLLAQWLDRDNLPPQADTLLERCGGHVLALRQLGSLVAQKIRAWGEDEAWDYALHQLASRRLPRAVDDTESDFDSIMETSLAALSKPARKRYLELAVFPDETPVPFDVLPTYWQITKYDAQDTVDAWLNLSLVELTEDHRLKLHDLQLDYTKALHETPELHAKLIGAYCKTCRDGNLARGPASDDRYFWSRVPYHLKHAGREAELTSLLMNPEWLQNKLDRLGVAALRADFDYVTAPGCLKIARALDLSSEVLAGDASQLRSQIYGRLLDQPHPELRAQIQAIAPQLALRPLHRTLDGPGDIDRRLRGHVGDVSGISMLLHGGRAISVSKDGTLIVWNTKTGGIENRLRDRSGLFSVAVTPDGLHALAGTGGGRLIIFDLLAGEIVRTIDTQLRHSVESVAITPDGKRAMCAVRNHPLVVLNLLSGDLERYLQPPRSGGTSCVTALPDGLRAISAGDALIVWNLDTGAIEQQLALEDSYHDCVAVTFDGRFVISGTSSYIMLVLDLRTGQVTQRLKGHTHWVKALAVMADNQRFISASADQSLIVWNLHTGRIERRLEGHDNWVNAVAVTRDGTHALSASGRTLILWDLLSDTPTTRLERHSDWVQSVAITANGQIAVSASNDRSAIVWDVLSGQPQRILPGRSGPGHLTRHAAVALTPDGRRAISESADGHLVIWDTETAQIERSLKDEVWALAVTPDGARAVSGCDDLTVVIRSLFSGEVEHRLVGHSGYVWAVAVTSDCRQVVSGDINGTIIVWDLEKGEIERVLEDHPSPISSVVMMPGGNRLLSGSYDGCLVIWDLTTGKIDRRLEAHRDPVSSLAITPDGRWAVSASLDATIKIWNLNSDHCSEIFNLDNSVHSVAMSTIPPYRVVAGDSRGTVHFFVVQT
jgi:WD40 repeat protein